MSRWITIEAERVLYVGRGRDVILCDDRCDGPRTVVLKLTGDSIAKLQTELAMNDRCPHCHQEVNLSLIVEEFVTTKPRNVGDIRFLVRGKTTATDKEVHNALAFLKRHGRIKKVGHGVYQRVAPGQSGSA